MGPVRLLLIGALRYLLGSFPSGVVVVRVWTGEDLRRVGRGHTGGMNVRRVAGLAPAIVTVLADAAKAIVAVKLAETVGTPSHGRCPLPRRRWSLDTAGPSLLAFKAVRAWEAPPSFCST